MHESVPHVTMDPSCHLPSTWKTGKLGVLTDKVIRDYEREGWYGPDAQKRVVANDKARVVNGITRLPKPCQACHKRDGFWMVYSYLPKAGHYCDHCRQGFKQAVEDEKARRAAYRDGSAFE